MGMCRIANKALVVLCVLLIAAGQQAAEVNTTATPTPPPANDTVVPAAAPVQQEPVNPTNQSTPQPAQNITQPPTPEPAQPSTQQPTKPTQQPPMIQQPVPTQPVAPQPATPPPPAAEVNKTESPQSPPPPQPKPEEPAAPAAPVVASIPQPPVIEVAEVKHEYKPSQSQQPPQEVDDSDVLIEDIKVTELQTPPPAPSISPQELQRQQKTQHQQNLVRDSIQLDFAHVRSYSFNLGNIEDFVISVSSDHEIKGILNIYWRQESTYIMSGYKLGEEVTLLIYENHQLIFNKQFYQSSGFKFQAKKGVQYLLRFDKKGLDKLVLMHVNNYVADDKLENTLTNHTIHAHHQRELLLFNKLKNFLDTAQRHALLNDNISQAVLERTRAYMAYQMTEMVFVVMAAVSQFYMIRRLAMGSTSVV